MEETKHSQVMDRSTRGTSSRLRWLFPFFTISINFLIASILLLMRAAGSFQVQQSFLPLVMLGGLLSCLSLGTLLLIRYNQLMDLSKSQKYCLTLALVLPILGGILAALPVGQWTPTGGLVLVVIYFLAFIGVLELVEREAAKLTALPSECHYEGQQFSQSEGGTRSSKPKQVLLVEEENREEPSELIEEGNEALLKALLEQPTDSAQEVIEFDEEQENRSQWMSRVTEPNGSEVVDGGALVQFAIDQNVSVVHIGLFPPLSGILSVSCDSEFGTTVRTRILETRGYGISVEVKRGHNLEEEFETYLYYRITNIELTEDVA